MIYYVFRLRSRINITCPVHGQRKIVLITKPFVATDDFSIFIVLAVLAFAGGEYVRVKRSEFINRSSCHIAEYVFSCRVFQSYCNDFDFNSRRSWHGDRDCFLFCSLSKALRWRSICDKNTKRIWIFHRCQRRSYHFVVIFLVTCLQSDANVNVIRFKMVEFPQFHRFFADIFLRINFRRRTEFAFCREKKSLWNKLRSFAAACIHIKINLIASYDKPDRASHIESNQTKPKRNERVIKKSILCKTWIVHIKKSVSLALSLRLARVDVQCPCVLWWNIRWSMINDASENYFFFFVFIEMRSLTRSCLVFKVDERCRRIGACLNSPVFVCRLFRFRFRVFFFVSQK